jgi:hypothetical protein
MIKIPVSYGELLDKYSILLIKLQKITDEKKLTFVNKETAELSSVCEKLIQRQEQKNLFFRLMSINQLLWEVEDNLREMERKGEFGKDFVIEARKVYHLNDMRASVKGEINILLGSDIQEVKSYSEY